MLNSRKFVSHTVIPIKCGIGRRHLNNIQIIEYCYKGKNSHSLEYQTLMWNRSVYKFNEHILQLLCFICLRPSTGV